MGTDVCGGAQGRLRFTRGNFSPCRRQARQPNTEAAACLAGETLAAALPATASRAQIHHPHSIPRQPKRWYLFEVEEVRPVVLRGLQRVVQGRGVHVHGPRGVVPPGPPPCMRGGGRQRWALAWRRRQWQVLPGIGRTSKGWQDEQGAPARRRPRAPQCAPGTEPSSMTAMLGYRAASSTALTWA